MAAAIVEVLDAGQRVLLDRMELLSLEARAAGAGALTSFALLMCGLGLLLVGWLAANALVIVLIARTWTPAEGIALVAGVNLAAGGIALVLARRQSTSMLSARSNTDHDAARAANGGSTE